MINNNLPPLLLKSVMFTKQQFHKVQYKISKKSSTAAQRDYVKKRILVHPSTMFRNPLPPLMNNIMIRQQIRNAKLQSIHTLRIRIASC